VSGIEECGSDIGANEACDACDEIAIHCLNLSVMAVFNHGRIDMQSR
jgi:hypothetical protein